MKIQKLEAYLLPCEKAFTIRVKIARLTREKRTYTSLHRPLTKAEQYNVDEISRSIEKQKVLLIVDPLDDYCELHPEVDECRVYDI